MPGARWWFALAGRERMMLAGGALAALLLLAYALLWLPLDQEIKRLRGAVASERDELAWVRQAAARLGAHKQTPGADTAAVVTDRSVSLLTLIDRSARAAGLVLTRVDPRPDRQASVRFEQVGFDALLAWLARLAREHRVSVVSAVVEPVEAAGRVDARLLLRGGS